VVKKTFAINRMDTLQNRSPAGDAQQRPPLPVMRRSEGETGSIGISMRLRRGRTAAKDEPSPL
jgi:hypothetical protein